VNAAEAELTMRLASTAPVREAARPRLARLLRRVDTDAYTGLLAERGLLGLLGSRAIELAPEAADELLRSRVDASIREHRLHAMALDATLRQVVKALEDSGIPALPIKGTTLADRVYGDTGLRPTMDVDVLVPPAQVGEAVEVLRALGYAAPEDPPWTGGLPELHYTFESGGAVPARIELHWRVHWAERGFSDELLRASREAPDRLRRAEPTHELALLLLIYARDGLHGPRLATDIAAWWDRFGDRLAPGALDGVVARRPSLRRSIVAALVCVERFLGVDARGVLTDAAPDRSTRWAVALADPLLEDEGADLAATIMIIDALLSMGTDKLGFVRRYFLQPLPHARSVYDLHDAPAAMVALYCAMHGLASVVKKSPRMVRAAIRARRRASHDSSGPLVAWAARRSSGYRKAWSATPARESMSVHEGGALGSLTSKRERPLRPGDVVEVKSAAEILATLDEGGSLDKMPFMPEMIRHAGRRYTVSRRVDKICDTIAATGSRRMHETVYLDDLRCDGSGHGGCQAGCKIYWKESWLRRVEGGSGTVDAGEGDVAQLEQLAQAGTRTVRDLEGAATEVWRCQATEAFKASEPLKTSNLAQYWREFTNGNFGPFRFIRLAARGFVLEVANRLGLLKPLPLQGPGSQQAPTEPLELKPGDRVKVRPPDEIATTLDEEGLNRGLSFDREMLPYCGRAFRVKDRVQRIIDDRTGRMLKIPKDCLVLDGAVCSGERSAGRWFCPREIYPFWREAWLERVEEADGGRSTPEQSAPQVPDSSR
jgi:Uncharacterised nucleotidyltransferase